MADSIVPFSFLASIATLLLTRNVSKALSVLMVDYLGGKGIQADGLFL